MLMEIVFDRIKIDSLRKSKNPFKRIKFYFLKRELIKKTKHVISMSITYDSIMYFINILELLHNNRMIEHIPSYYHKYGEAPPYTYSLKYIYVENRNRDNEIAHYIKIKLFNSNKREKVLEVEHSTTMGPTTHFEIGPQYKEDTLGDVNKLRFFVENTARNFMIDVVSRIIEELEVI